MYDIPELRMFATLKDLLAYYEISVNKQKGEVKSGRKGTGHPDRWGCDISLRVYEADPHQIFDPEFGEFLPNAFSLGLRFDEEVDGESLLDYLNSQK